MEAIIRDALPEFVGSLGATLTIATGAWGITKFRKRDDDQPPARRSPEETAETAQEGDSR